ncbi:DUF1801 domain-containing protein [Allorhodopirellula heiligendammensis]|uniref:YdhG-like domain-containing protein n=1 Tax=Allorhodopirellula heiligendammensis TaxID=2714739 RepID=A0A5C6BXU1_9BACT|nr:DUF1801 domain-containing protein [Allorhodopirellula heiligendammensis]TWU16066.1 hypothetical protein Poly21_32710 [Allorhodopirellula heiligendammensis]
MKSDAHTVDDYLSELDPERKRILIAVRQFILNNLQPGFAEGMQYGMIGYYVPHSRYPAGYHCKPSEPLPFLSLASQKNYCSLYAMSLYSDADQLKAFQERWKQSGKKLNMGKSCIRFKQTDDLALDLIAEHLRAISVEDWIATYERLAKR